MADNYSMVSCFLCHDAVHLSVAHKAYAHRGSDIETVENFHSQCCPNRTGDPHECSRFTEHEKADS